MSSLHERYNEISLERYTSLGGLFYNIIYSHNLFKFNLVFKISSSFILCFAAYSGISREFHSL